MLLTRRTLLSTAVAAAVRAQNADDRMGAAKDLLYQALELLSQKSSTDQIRQAIRFINHSLDQYASFGDAHYYRHLCLKRIKENPVAQATALEAAATYHSEALHEKRDPFQLSVPQIQDLSKVGQKWALVVGISRFQPDTGASSLTCAAADANAFADLLRNPDIGRFRNDQVFCLTDEKATTAGIKARLNRIATKATSEDIVVVYISTHGSSRSEDIKQVSYLYTYDTDVTSKDDIFGSALPMVEISGIISTRCTAQRTVLIFDTCHSGESVNSQAISAGDADRLREGAGRYILSSCAADQVAYEDARHGYFTASLVELLTARKGCVRIGDLFSDVEKQVSRRAAAAGKSQHPVMFRSENSAEIILGTPPESTNEQCVAAIHS